MERGTINGNGYGEGDFFNLFVSCEFDVNDLDKQKEENNSYIQKTKKRHSSRLKTLTLTEGHFINSFKSSIRVSNDILAIIFIIKIIQY